MCSTVANIQALFRWRGISIHLEAKLQSGDKSHARNYRPISILEHIAKLFEKIVLKDITPSVNPTLICE